MIERIVSSEATATRNHREKTNGEYPMRLQRSIQNKYGNDTG
jgi:hypothetical protein